MKAKFKHLYDDKHAFFIKSHNRWEQDQIVFSSGFIPEKNVQYDVSLERTNGTFVYNGYRYELTYARLIDAADIIDMLDCTEFSYTPLWGENKTRQLTSNPFQKLKGKM